MATGAIGGTRCTPFTFDTDAVGGKTIDLSAFAANGVGVRVLVTVSSSVGTNDLSIGDVGGLGGWVVEANDKSIELGIFDPDENITIDGVAGLRSTGKGTIAPANR